MKILLAADHAGFKLKNLIKDFLVAEGLDVEDMGAHTFVPDDNYPEIMLPVAIRVLHDIENTKAIIFGKSGQGEAIICNRMPGIRAVVYHGKNLEIVRLSREHNDANILSIGAGFVEEEEAKEAVKIWISTAFDTRHQKRIEMLDNIE
ncbi:MAG: RpiB/LacA/LacB family sugar-phosphate isomerase [Candidatus Taylorbacteria bacterium]|nr:RpiB/LacA/LacB family sugar-phosphate isomerase [Candidatus Taylorbacteria bacterium]